VDRVNPFEKMGRRLDAAQQRVRAAAVLFGVMKKFGDDNAGTLVNNLAYCAFICIFPLLLVFITLLNILLVGHAGARKDLLNTALGQFPVIGSQLGHNIHGLHRSSVIGLAVGVLALIWGSTGLAQAGLFSMSQVWNLAGPERPNYVSRLARSMLFLVVLGLGLVVSTAMASFGTFGHHNIGLGIASEILAVVVNGGVYFLAFRTLTPKAVGSRSLIPGSIVGGVAWTILQAVGGYLIGHDLRNDSVTYGVFGVVLGLIAWTYLGCEVTIYAAELNCVLAHHLWPRGLIQPPLTEADQRSIALQATQNQRRPEQNVSVQFDEAAMTQGDWLASRSTSADQRAEGDPDKKVESSRR
jgi:YihY family inner membrane protein